MDWKSTSSDDRDRPLHRGLQHAQVRHRSQATQTCLLAIQACEACVVQLQRLHGCERGCECGELATFDVRNRHRQRGECGALDEMRELRRPAVFAGPNREIAKIQARKTIVCQRVHIKSGESREKQKGCQVHRRCTSVAKRQRGQSSELMRLGAHHPRHLRFDRGIEECELLQRTHLLDHSGRPYPFPRESRHAERLTRAAAWRTLTDHSSEAPCAATSATDAQRGCRATSAPQQRWEPAHSHRADTHRGVQA